MKVLIAQQEAMGGLKWKVMASTSFSTVAPKMALDTMCFKISLQSYNSLFDVMRMREIKTENKVHSSRDTERFDHKYTRIT